jgi:hypothetical protein
LIGRAVSLQIIVLNSDTSGAVPVAILATAAVNDIQVLLDVAAAEITGDPSGAHGGVFDSMDGVMNWIYDSGLLERALFERFVGIDA